MIRNSMQVISILIVLFSCSSTTNQQGPQVLESDQFELQMKNEGVQLIDVRTPNEYNQGHLPNAILLDYSGGQLQKSLDKLDKDKPVMVYCAVGGRSGRAAKLLSESGFKVVYDLQGGIRDWTSQGKKVILD
ncbi:MAG: rhodanese-like domain-containing protein [Cyclobacteriaceae bacterium]